MRKTRQRCFIEKVSFYTKGADTVLGFTDKIYTVQAYLWTRVFMESLSYGSTIEYAMTVADATVEEDDDCKACPYFSTDSEYRYLVGSSSMCPCA